MADEKAEYFQANSIYIIDVGVTKAINLPKADTFGKSDGFVKVECRHRKFRTKTIKKSLNPEWNAETQFQFIRKPTQIKFRVLDWNSPPQKDSPLGNYMFSIDDEYWSKGNEGFSGTVTLSDCKRGEIVIWVKCKILNPGKMFQYIKDCTAKLQTCKEKQGKCDNSIVECTDEAEKQQQAILAYTEHCTDVKEETERYKTLRDGLDDSSSECDKQIRECEQDCRKQESNYQDLEKLYTETADQCQEVSAEYVRKKERYEREYEAYQQQMQTWQEEAAQRAQQAAYEQQQQQYEAPQYEQKEEQVNYSNPIGYTADTGYGDTQGNVEDVDEDRADLMGRIKKYTVNVGRYANDEEIEEYDEDLCTDIVSKYKECRDVYVEVDEEDIEEEEEEEYAQARVNGGKYLIEIQKWAQGCNEALYRKKDGCVDKYELNDEEGRCKQFFNEFYVRLNKFLFCIQIMGATLEVFKKEIKALTNKKSTAVTYNDLNKALGGGDADSEDGTAGDTDKVWDKIYDDMGFVMEEIGNVFTDYMSAKPLQNLCKVIRDFMSDCYSGDYTQFSEMISLYLAMIISDSEEYDQEISISSLAEDTLSATILILNDKRQFCKKLWDSVENSESVAKKDGSDASENEYAESEEEIEEIQDQFEQLLAYIIVSVVKLVDCFGVDKLEKKDKDAIKEQLEEVKGKCGELNIDAKSVKLVRQFFIYFYAPENGGGVCCTGGAEGGGFFASLFGSICK